MLASLPDVFSLCRDVVSSTWLSVCIFRLCVERGWGLQGEVAVVVLLLLPPMPAPLLERCFVHELAVLGMLEVGMR